MVPPWKLNMYVDDMVKQLKARVDNTGKKLELIGNAFKPLIYLCAGDEMFYVLLY